MVKPPADPNAPTPTQAAVLAEAVFDAFRRGWNGKLGTDHSPLLGTGDWRRTGVPLGTRKAAERKGLVLIEQPGAPGGGRIWRLSESGVKAGIASYQERYDMHPRTRARELAETERDRQRKAAARVKEAQHLWRGLRLSSATKGSRSVSKAITGMGRLELTVDDMIAIGKDIEKLRKAAERTHS